MRAGYFCIQKSSHTGRQVGSSFLSVMLAGVSRPLRTESSMGWVDPWVGFGRVGLGRDFSVFGGLGWVHYSKSTKNLKGLR